MTGRETLHRLSPVLAGLLALALYVLTMAPGLFWGDSAQLQTATAEPRLGFGGRDYALWTLVSSAVMRLTGSSPALAANLASGLWGAVAVALCFAYARRVTGVTLAAAVAAAALAVSHLHWSSSSVAEVYSAASCFLLLLLFAADGALSGRRGPAFLLGLVMGVSLLHHRMIQVAAVGVLLPLLWRWRRSNRLGSSLAAASVGGLLGAVPMAILIVTTSSSGGLFERVTVFLLGATRPSLPDGLGLGRGLLGLVAYEGRFLCLNLAGPQLVLALRASLPSLSILAGMGGVGIVCPFLFADLGDRFVLLLPAVCAACVLAAVGTSRFRGPIVRTVLLLATAALPIALRDLARAVLDRVPAGSLLLAGWGEGEPIRYVQVVEGHGTAVELKIRYHADALARARAARRTTRLFVSGYPHLDLHVDVPPGHRLEPIIPRALWELVPAAGGR